MAQLLRIRNTSPDKPLKLPHDGLGHVTIKPGEEAILPSSYGTVFFGNPAARNDTKELARETEHKRVLQLWGIYPGLKEEGLTEAETAAEAMPAFEVADMDGERIFMVLDDPDGTLGGDQDVELSTAERSNAQLQAQVADLQAQMAQLMAAMSRETVAAVPEPAPAAIPAGEQSAPAPAADPDGTAQATRNEARDDIPKPSGRPGARKDTPRTPRTGTRA